MIRLAVRQILSDPARSSLTCAGVASVLAVILVLQGFREGLSSQLRAIALERGADLIAAQSGVENMVGARSVIPQLARGDVEGVAGVRAAYPMTIVPVIYERGGRKSPAFLTAVDSIGAVPPVVSGRGLEDEGDVLVDRSLARIFDLSPGDAWTVGGYDFQVAGVVEPTAALWTSFAFVSFESLIEFYFEADLADDLSAFPLVSYLLVRVDEGTDRESVAARIEAAVPDVDVHTPEELAANDEALGETMMGVIVDVLIAVGYTAGLLVISLFMFTTAEWRRRDLGVLKALGFTDRAILASVISEAGLLTALAVPVGVALAVGLSTIVTLAFPLYAIRPTEPLPVLQVIMAGTLFALLGAAAPSRLIRDIEPMEVFRR